MLASLSTGQKLGLGLAAGCFIVFALLSSFVFPRRWPDFPGKGRNAFIAVCLGFFVAMMLAVVFIAREEEEPEGEEPAQVEQPAALPARAVQVARAAQRAKAQAHRCRYQREAEAALF